MSSIRTEVYRNRFWMMHHGSKSPKRTIVWSPRKILVLGLAGGLKTNINVGPPKDKGPLRKAEKEKKTKVKTSRHALIWHFERFPAEAFIPNLMVLKVSVGPKH